MGTWLRVPGALQTIGIVMPVLNEAATITGALAQLPQGAIECIVVDGGSTDHTLQLAHQAGARVIQSERGRARQMNAGAAASSADILVFLHADCVLPSTALDTIRLALTGQSRWGRFDVHLTSKRMLLRLVGAMMNLRSRLTGIATGDQAIFVDRYVFESLGGYADIELMEDIELSARLRKLSAPCCLRDQIQVSPRRWERRGVLRTVLQMWTWRAAYRLGVSPKWLHQRYYG